MHIIILSLFSFGLLFDSLLASTSNGTILNSSYSTSLVCADASCSPSLGHRINFKPTLGVGINPITISDVSGLDGQAWGESIGWINFSAGNTATTTPGVQVNPATGALYGYAWAQNSGWINFAPTSYGVSINSNGEFVGFAWASGQNGGWVKFDCGGGATTTCVKTDWLPLPARAVAPSGGGGSGGGGGGGSVVIPNTGSSTYPSFGGTGLNTQSGPQNQTDGDFSTLYRSDINDSGFVDVFDFNLLQVHWGKENSNILNNIGAAKIDRCKIANIADINCDGRVNLLDFNLIFVNWAQYVGPKKK